MDLTREKLGNSTGIKGLGPFPGVQIQSQKCRGHIANPTLVQASTCKGWNRKREVSTGSYFWAVSVLRVRGKYSDSGMGRSRTKEKPQAERTDRSQVREVRLPSPPLRPEAPTWPPEVDAERMGLSEKAGLGSCQDGPQGSPELVALTPPHTPSGASSTGQLQTVHSHPTLTARRSSYLQCKAGHHLLGTSPWSSTQC